MGIKQNTKQVRITEKTHIKLVNALADIYSKTKKKITVIEFIDRAIVEKLENNQILNNN